MFTNRLGEINRNTFGTEMKIIAYRGSSDVDVMFLDSHGYIYQHALYANFKNGYIKNPFDPIFFNKGYLGDGKYKCQINNNMQHSYTIWNSMLARCYGNRITSYTNSSWVCSDWFNYQNFAKWYEENEYPVKGRLHMDKDILYPGNKIYSPYHCLLVPQRINMLFTNKMNKSGLPNGITKYKDGYVAKYNGEEIGKAKTIKEAYCLYANRKKEIIIKIANEYKNIIPDRVYQALLSYEVRLENDKNYNYIKEAS